MKNNMTRREFIAATVVAAAPVTLFGSGYFAYDEKKEENCSEFDKCRKDILYFAEKYLKVGKDGRSIVLKEWQRKYLKHLASGKYATLNAHRQSGVTTTNIAYAVWKCLTTPDELTPIAYVTESLWASEDCCTVIDSMIRRLPKWMQYCGSFERRINVLSTHTLESSSELLRRCGVVIFDNVKFDDDTTVRVALTIPENLCKQMVFSTTKIDKDDNILGKYSEYVRTELGTKFDYKNTDYFQVTADGSGDICPNA